MNKSRIVPASVALAAFLGMRMSTSPEMDDLEAAVQASDGVIDSAVTFINGLAPMIEAAAGDKAASVALAADVRARAATLASAIATGTGSGPTP